MTPAAKCPDCDRFAFIDNGRLRRHNNGFTGSGRALRCDGTGERAPRPWFFLTGADTREEVAS